MQLHNIFVPYLENKKLGFHGKNVMIISKILKYEIKFIFICLVHMLLTTIFKINFHWQTLVTSASFSRIIHLTNGLKAINIYKLWLLSGMKTIELYELLKPRLNVTKDQGIKMWLKTHDQCCTGLEQWLCQLVWPIHRQLLLQWLDEGQFHCTQEFDPRFWEK